MKRRRLVWVAVAALVLVGAGVAAALLDPAARVTGWVNGEPFYQGRAATAWGRDLRQSDEVASHAARDALAAGKGEAAPVCGWLLTNAPEPQVRSLAVSALQQMGKEAQPAAPALVAALADPDPLVRGAAVRVVNDLAPQVPGAVPALVKLFPDVEAVRAVARFGPHAAEATLPLSLLLRHESPAVRRQAARALGKVGEAALPILPELMRLTATDPDDGVREQAAEAFGAIGPAAAAAVPVLVKALKDPAKMVRRDAVRSLGQIGPAAAPALPDVKALLNDPEPEVRAAAGLAARRIDPTATDKK